jgi:hypothetical protein
MLTGALALGVGGENVTPNFDAHHIALGFIEYRKARTSPRVIGDVNSIVCGNRNAHDQSSVFMADASMRRTSPWR